jgi:tetratricopeptide (TPR) repeat protein
MKWLMYLVLIALAASSWMYFSKKGREIHDLNEQIIQIENIGDPNEELGGLRSKLGSLEGDRTLSGILLTFISAGIVGIIIVVYLLPFFAQRITHAVYDSAEMVERDVMHDARALVAQGEYHAAIEAFKEAAKAEPLNRLPWVEIAKIYKDNLEDPVAATETIRYALESQEWEINDAAYFLFRLAELYDEVLGDRASAISILHQVVEQFPRTRHSANATTRLHEWGADEAQMTEQQLVMPEPPPPPVMPEPPPPSVVGTRYEIPTAEEDEPGGRA